MDGIYPCTRVCYGFSCRACFLRNMVRAIVGSLVDVGRGRRTPEWFASIIGTGTRSDAGESVPGNALFLNKVTYPPED